MKLNTHATAAIATVSIPIMMALGIGAAYVNPLAKADDYALPACQEEDGNINGLPCAWTDPGTGNVYYVSSEDYR